MSNSETPALREPARPVSVLAPRFWRWKAAITATPFWVIGVAALIFAPGQVDHSWRWILAAVGVVALLMPLPWLTLAPRIRYRVHRWDVTDLALHVRHGWITRTDEIVPISRIQTVDSVQGLLQAQFGLRTVIVSTASKAGTVVIAQLDDATAQSVVAHLVTITAATAEDAT